ncbi:MAG: aldehyde ferredoxin oxidoreductase family protein [Bacillota bacterium]
MTEKLYGYAGKQLRVSLSEEKVKEENLKENVLKKYLGGSGYGIKVLYEELEKGIDPLSRDNKLVLATSPLTDRRVPGGGSLEVCFKSPLTGTWGEARVGDEFGFAMKAAGYDFLIVEDKAEKPSYLVVEDGKVVVKDAAHLAGKSSTEKAEKIEEDLGEGYSILTIGQGGENEVLYSAIMINHRAVGRGGAGAVMGSKNLLAIAAKGDKKVDIADKDKFMEAVRKTNKKIREHPDSKAFREHGTVGDLGACDVSGDFPTKNWNANSWGKGEELYDYFYENNLVSNKQCYRGCPVGCGRIAEVKEGKYRTPQHEGAEYETIAAFTAFVLNEDMDIAVHCDYLCNEYGIDTISTGASIAFAMECYEHGLLSDSDVDNLDLSWGNGEVLPVLVEKIAKREGIGKLLAKGVKRAAEKLGKEAEEFAVQVKGLEAPAHDPRSGKALAVSYGTGSRGSCHIHPVEAMGYDGGKMDFELSDFGLTDPEEVDKWDEEGKGKEVKLLQDGGTLPDIMGTCKFMFYVGAGIKEYAEILEGLTGWKVDGWDLLEIGERAINLQKLFNIREGFAKEDDMIHPRMGAVPEFGDYHDVKDCAIQDFPAMLNEYYEARDWNKKTGIPEKSKLKELGLGEFA